MADISLTRALQAQRVLTGGAFVIAGCTQLFLIGNDRLELLFMQLGLPLAFLLAWLVPLVGLGAGIAVICNYRVRHTAWPALLLALGAAFTVYWYGPGSIKGAPNWTQVFVHLVLASNLLVLALSAKR